MKRNQFCLLLVCATSLIWSNATAVDIAVPNGSGTNSLTLGVGEFAYRFAHPPVLAGMTPSVNAPSLSTNFAGTTNNLYYPPDTMGAVGTNRLMIMINGQVRIQDRAGNFISSTSLNSWWSGAGSYSDNPGRFVFDPRLTYDPYSHRWIAVAIANPANSSVYSQLLIGVSATSDPSGTWYQYAYSVSPSGLYYADYPQFGFNKDKVVVVFQYRLISADSPDSNGLVVFDKNSLYSGSTPIFSSQILSSNTYGFYLQPAITYDTNISTVFLVQSANPNSGGNGLVRLYSVTGAATNVTVSTIGTVQAAAWAGKFSTDTAGQKGTTVKMNTLDDRMNQAVYRSGNIWCAHTICLPSSSPNRSAVQFWQITTNALVSQQGIIEDSTGLTNYAFPSISVNRFGDAMVGFANFSTNNYPGASYTARSPLDLVGSIENVASLKTGLDSYWRTDGGSRNRWGDYTATQVDPINDTDFWTLQEYANAHVGTFTNGSGQWALWWGNLVLPNPGNNTFTNAYTISGVQGSTNGTTLRATRETGEPNHAGVTNSPSGWYKWVAPSNGTVMLTISGNSAQLILAVYTGTNVSSLTLVTNSIAVPPKTIFNATSNTTYRIAVAGNNGVQGNFTLNWVQPSAPLFELNPQSTNVAIGETAILNALAIATPSPAYQWRREGINVTGAISATLTITNIQFSNGTNYVVVATNIAGSVTSAPAAIYIWPDSSARLTGIQLTTNQQFVFSVAGLTNRPYRIEASTNLGTTNWVTVYTNYVSFWYTNSSMSNAAQQFFRAITN